jgi:hypothetical protein
MAFAVGEDQADAVVDFSRNAGYWVRLDVEVESIDGRALEAGHFGWLALSPTDAERLAARLQEAAAEAIRQNQATT